MWLLAILFLSQNGISGDCEGLITNKGTWGSGRPEAMYGRGDYVFVGANHSGIQVFDVSDPTAPRVVTGFRAIDPDEPEVLFYAEDLVVFDNYLYLAALSGGSETDRLFVFDITDLSRPLQVFSMDIDASITYYDRLVIAGQHLYAQRSPSDIDVFDLTEPANPLRINTIPADNAYDIAAKGNLLLTSYNDRLTIMDMTDPLNPLSIGQISLSRQLGRMAIVGDYVYLVGAGVEIIDISDPESPNRVYEEDFSNRTLLMAEGNMLALYERGLMLLDISNPELPVEMSVTGFSPDLPVDVHIAGSIINMIGSSGLYILDAADLSQPKTLGSHLTSGRASDVVVRNGFAFLAHAWSGFRILSLADPDNLLPVFHYHPSFPPRNYDLVALIDHTAYLLNPNSSCGDIFDIADPMAAQHISIFCLFPGIRDVTTWEGHLYVVSETGGFGIVQSDELVGSLAVNGISVAAAGDRAIIGQPDGGIVLVDISDPTSPVQLGSSSTTSPPVDVAMTNDTAFIADGDSVLVFPLTNLELPLRLASIGGGVEVTTLEIKGNNLFIGFADGSLTVMDISTSLPTVALRHDNQNRMIALDMNENLLVTAADDEGSIHVYGFPSIDLPDGYALWMVGTEEKHFCFDTNPNVLHFVGFINNGNQCPTGPCSP